MLKQGKATMKLLVLTVLMLGAAVAAWAQSTGTLRGIITDTQGAIVPGVSVVVRNQATGAERTIVSDSSGAYVAASLPPGPYRVQAQLQGFQGQSKDVDVDVAQTVVVDMKLGVAGVAEQVNVTGSTPVIDTATSSVGQVISAADRAGDSAQWTPLRRSRSADSRLGHAAAERVPERAATRAGLVRVQHGGQSRRHRELHDQRRQPQRSGAEPDHVPAVDQHGVRVQGRQLDVQRRIRPQLGRHREHRDAGPAPTTSMARRSSSSATPGSIRATSSTRSPRRNRRSAAISSARTSAARS